MGQRHPDARRHRRQPKGDDFAVQLLGGMMFVAVVTWVATPMVSAGWTSATSTPEQNAARERSVYYPGCEEAAAAGAAPIYRGQPGYRPGMDGDDDGIACESY